MDRIEVLLTQGRPSASNEVAAEIHT